MAHYARRFQGAPEEQLRRLAAGRFAVGTPAQVADDLVALHRVGITHLSMRVSWPGMPQDDILAGIEILGREVLLAVRRRTALSDRRVGKAASGAPTRLFPTNK